MYAILVPSRVTKGNNSCMKQGNMNHEINCMLSYLLQKAESEQLLKRFMGGKHVNFHQSGKLIKTYAQGI